MVARHCDSVELFVNGQSLGIVKTPQNDFVYPFPNVAFAPGSIKAVATKGGEPVAQEEIQTAGEPKAIKLTLYTGPKGMRADSADVALVDFEVVDAQNRRCPTDPARVDFDIAGPAIWRGGLNSAKTKFNQQPLSRHRVRHQPRLHPLHAHTGDDRPDGQTRRLAARHDHI